MSWVRTTGALTFLAQQGVLHTPAMCGNHTIAVANVSSEKLGGWGFHPRFFKNGTMWHQYMDERSQLGHRVFGDMLSLSENVSRLLGRARLFQEEQIVIPVPLVEGEDISAQLALAMNGVGTYLRDEKYQAKILQTPADSKHYVTDKKIDERERLQQRNVAAIPMEIVFAAEREEVYLKAAAMLETLFPQSVVRSMNHGGLEIVKGEYAELVLEYAAKQEGTKGQNLMNPVDALGEVMAAGFKTRKALDEEFYGRLRGTSHKNMTARPLAPVDVLFLSALVLDWNSKWSQAIELAGELDAVRFLRHTASMVPHLFESTDHGPVSIAVESSSNLKKGDAGWEQEKAYEEVMSAAYQRQVDIEREFYRNLPTNSEDGTLMTRPFDNIDVNIISALALGLKWTSAIQIAELIDPQRFKRHIKLMKQMADR